MYPAYAYTDTIVPKQKGDVAEARQEKMLEFQDYLSLTQVPFKPNSTSSMTWHLFSIGELPFAIAVEWPLYWSGYLHSQKAGRLPLFFRSASLQIGQQRDFSLSLQPYISLKSESLNLRFEIRW